MKQIGILLDYKLIQLARQGKRSYERLNYYEKIGKELGLKPVFFHPLHVNFRKKQVNGYLLKGGRLVPHETEIPPVIHNRILTSIPEVNQLIRMLGRLSKVYNGVVERDKLRIHQILWKNPELRPYLPETKPYSREELRAFLRKYQVFYIKRVIGFVGHGVIRVERSGSRYVWTSARQQKKVSKQVLIQHAAKWMGNKQRFLLQQAIPLLTYQGQTFDIRVSVQKNGDGRWNVSGMVAKIANPKNKLSNLARGGRAVPLGQVLADIFGPVRADQVKEAIRRASVAITTRFEQESPTLADVGLDMGIDRDGNPYLIEINVRDQRYSFLLAGERRMFQNTYRQPLEYAKYLLAKQESNDSGADKQKSTSEADTKRETASFGAFSLNGG
ncbi:MAG: YheC/YheD family protein [Brevibacillus sp.]|nr:YheC/YheD family protein [Brevibacillus sp.]